MAGDLTHFDEEGASRMVDVGEKAVTSRMARASGRVVSSLERPEDQERGLALGADAYVVKRKFDQGELLATIRQIL